MNEELVRKVKKSKLNHYKTSDYMHSVEHKATFTDNFKVNLSKPPLIIPQSLESNEASENSNFLCSHEEIKIHFNLSSGQSSSVSNLKPSCKSDKDHSPTSKFVEKQTLVQHSIQELLSMDDDSLLEKVNLSFEDLNETKPFENQNTKTNCAPIVDRIQKLDEAEIAKVDSSKNILCCDSPDIFKSNEEEDVDPDEQAWDMSIRIEDEKDKSVNEGCNVSKNTAVSPGLNDLVLSTWVLSEDSSPKDKRVSFENLLKKTLTSNANKAVISHSSPRLKLLFSPSNSTDNSFFGLPSSVKRLIKRFKGITNLYDWQVECLNLPAIEKRKNLVYALPTSGGKTLVAEILVLKEILCREKNVLFVFPYVSIAQEKVRALSPFAVELGFLVEEYAGSKGAYPPQKRRRKRCVYVATIEKALGLVHSLIECQRIQELGLIVVDELHLVGEPKRGAHLESMLTKLIYMKGDVHIVGMSATIGNLTDIAKFLDADVYTQNFRPVELTEYVKVEDELFKVDYSIENDVPILFHSKIAFEYSQEQKKDDPDHIGALVEEVIPDQSCLIFCATKKNCENVAVLVCGVLDSKLTEDKCEEKKALFRALVTEGNGTVCPILRKTLPYGVAYHHSGLTMAERSLIEEAFLAKTICCICCTSTLAAGVNLPARRVILRSPYVGAQLLTLSKYKQMVGRAGRTGMGDVGESFLLCKPQDAQKVGELLSSAMDLCTSQLRGTGLECLIISAIDLGLTSTVENVRAMCQCSLLSVQATQMEMELDAEVNVTLERLVKAGALAMRGADLSLSKVGKAAVKANLDLETAKKLYKDLKLAQKSLVLLSHLHLLFLVTPYTMMDQIPLQGQTFCNAFMSLGPKEEQTARVLGVGEQCVAQLITGRRIKSDLNVIVHRLYLSLILFDLWNQNSIWKVSNTYSLPRGLVHNLLISASAFSASVVRFCEVIDEMWCFKLLLSEMSTRLTHCCSLELLPLMELPAVKIGRAKQLFNAGFKTLQILAKTEPKTLVQAVDHMPRKVAHQIVAAAKLMLLAKAESLQEEAEDVLEGLRIDNG